MDLSIACCWDCESAFSEPLLELITPVLYVISICLFIATFKKVSVAIYEWVMLEADGVYEGCEYSLNELQRAGVGMLFREFLTLVFVSNEGAMIEIQRIWRVRMTIRLTDGYWIRRSLRAGEVLESMFMNEIRMARDHARLMQNAIALQPSACETRCAYCRESIGTETPILCERCCTPHHQECFELNHGCSVFGCLNVSEAQLSETNQFWRLIRGTERNRNVLDLRDQTFEGRS